MINRCGLKDQDTIFQYIGPDYPSCLYLYLDIKRYGLSSDKIEVYFQADEDKISAILLKYYTCLHVYSKDNGFNAEEIADFFISNGYSILYTCSKIAKKVYSCFPEEIKKIAVSTDGWVARIDKTDKQPKGLADYATKLDFPQIVKLIYDDEDIGRSYNYDDLSKQMEERSVEGYSRNLVIKQNDLVVAHACTNAESDEIAVVAELLVRKEFRKKGLASEIWRDICNRLLSEKKEVYSIYYSEESRYIHRKIGFYEVCEWSKVVIPSNASCNI